jgi:thiol:disulfide interchange protein
VTRDAGGIEWASFAGGLASAKSRNTAMFVQFYATWCGACRTMDRNTLRDGKVIRKLQEMVAVRVNAEEQTPRDGLKGVDLASRFGVEAYPTLVVLDPAGREIARLVGAPDPPTFLRWLDDAIAGSSGARPGRDRTVRAANH